MILTAISPRFAIRIFRNSFEAIRNYDWLIVNESSGNLRLWGLDHQFLDFHFLPAEGSAKSLHHLGVELVAETRILSGNFPVQENLFDLYQLTGRRIDISFNWY